jgi:hypothetical protein
MSAVGFTSIERLLRDVHPAEVYATGFTAPIEARVFVTTERVQIWVEHGREMAFTEYRLTGEPPEPRRDTLAGQLHLDTSGGTLHISRGRGCGCHSSLKALAPPVNW